MRTPILVLFVAVLLVLAFGLSATQAQAHTYYEWGRQIEHVHDGNQIHFPGWVSATHVCGGHWEWRRACHRCHLHRVWVPEYCTHTYWGCTRCGKEL